MDKLVYLAMSGAKALEHRQHALTNNLANASTDGFRADTAAFRAVPVRAEGTATTRVYSLEASSGFDASSGPLRHTNRPMDVAVLGEGWFAARGPDNQEVYTRNGAFMLGPEGTLMTANGYPVVGDGGELVIPENATPIIASDGTVSAQVGDGLPVQVGRLKLVNPPADTLKKFDNGFLVTKDGQLAPADEFLRVTSGHLEGSNVNVVESMVGMIALSRQFDMQMRMIQNAESNEQRAMSVLSHNS